ncbi:MAG: DUF1080 domain-containing protein [Acidimicrobiia bacterium]|nr:DUF1080 domain-containing protein [Acidimicrobiia bacterium]
MSNSIERDRNRGVSRREFITDVGIAVAGAAVVPAAAEAFMRQQAISVTKSIKLFNGKDLSGLYTWLRKLGKNNDPNNVFTVNNGVMRISGEIYGGIITNQDYENYRCLIEFRWGEKMWQKGARDSGLCLHCRGEDGGFRGDWPENIEFQIYEGATGDFILLHGKQGVSVTVEGEMRGDKLFHYVPGKPATERAMIKDGKPTGITYIIPHLNRDPAWRSELGFRGKDTAEAPVGEWNTIEAVCDGGAITNIVNGRTVNKATNVDPRRGRICIQSEGAELFVRRWELLPL